MNKLIIIGNMTRDPETRATNNGKTVCTFTVAVDKSGGTEFFRVCAWEKLGEICGKYLAKGKKVAVTGSVFLKTYENRGNTRSYMEIRADEVEFLTKPEKADTAQEINDLTTDDIPF